MKCTNVTPYNMTDHKKRNQHIAIEYLELE